MVGFSWKKHWMLSEGHQNAGDTPLLQVGELGVRSGWVGGDKMKITLTVKQIFHRLWRIKAKIFKSDRFLTFS